MTKLFEIFSKPKQKIKKELPKPKVITDYREKNSLVISELIKLGLEVNFKNLKVADYLVAGIAIERKTVSDFISSMINKRLLRQLEEIQQYKNPLLMIEGIEEQELYNDENGTGVNANAIRGFLLSISLKHRIPIIFTKDYKDTAKFISVISKKKEKEHSLNVNKKTLNKKEQLQFILEGFPGIGPKTAKKLLKEFKTLKNIFNAPVEELKTKIGKKAEIFSLVKENY
ncbi:MAG: ERCC4 domain-containing protein [archaeon]